MKVLVTGDFCVAERAEHAFYGKVSPCDIFGEFSEIIQCSNLAITNLECPLTVSESAIQKIGPNLKAHPQTASLLKDAGFNFVTLANNHIFDYGQQGLEETLHVLRSNGIAYAGAGKDLKEAQQTYYAEIKNFKIAIVNFCEVEFSCANADHGGANPMDMVDNCRQIQEAQKNADHVLVIIHGGHEYYHYPSPQTLKRYRFYAENGASAVVAHHTHCIGGYENWMGVPIFYSLGNFFFPAGPKMPEMWYEGYALCLKISKDAVSFEILPYEQCRGGTMSISTAQRREIEKKIEEISRVLKDEDQLTQRWKEFIEKNTCSYLAAISGFGRYETAILRRLRLLEYFYKPSQLRFIRQMLHCESHRETCRSLLESFLKDSQ